MESEGNDLRLQQLFTADIKIFRAEELYVGNEKESIRPEELFKGLRINSRELFSGAELADFLQEWSNQDAFVEDLEYITGFDRGDAEPEEVFEFLADQRKYYTVDQMLEVAENWSDQDWQRPPNIGTTGVPVDISLGEKASVPREELYSTAEGDRCFRSKLTAEDKEVTLERHSSGWFQTEVQPVTEKELQRLFTELQRMAPAKGLHETVYGDTAYFIDSEDLDYFFEFSSELDEFDSKLYRIESDFEDFMLEASALPGKESYSFMIFSRDGEKYPLDAYRNLVDEQVVQGMRTRLELAESVE